jgi:hypothetical protein
MGGAVIPKNPPLDHDAGRRPICGVGAAGGARPGSSRSPGWDRRWPEAGRWGGASWYGVSVSGAGDVDGDGYSEVIIAASQYGNDANPPINEGRVQVYNGGGGVGASLNPRQRNHDSTPLAHLGRTKTWRAEACLLMKSPFWRGAMSVKENSNILSHPLDGGRTSWGFPTMQAYGATQCLELLGTYGTVYHWRARVLYGKVTHPYMPASRWVGMPYHGWNEADFRTVGSRLYLPLLMR